MSFIAKYLVIFVIIPILVNALNLTILHTNDFHARFEQTSVFSSQCSPKMAKNGQCFAGIARLIRKGKELKQGKENVLFLNAGDNLAGTILYQVYKWKIGADFIPLVGYDAMALGNHEFDDGVDNLSKYINKTAPTTPTICANIDLKDVPELDKNIRKSKVFTKGGKKIGVIGYITPETKFLSESGPNVKFLDEITSIREEAIRLKNEEQVNILIALGHSGYDKDVEIGQQIPEIDIVIGGHSNTFQYTGTPPSIEVPADPYPRVINHTNGDTTLVITAYAYGKYIGVLDVVFDDNGKITGWSGNPILINQSVAEDPEAKQLLDLRVAQIRDQFSAQIGKTRVFLQGDSSICRVRECNLGNLIADAFVHSRLIGQNSPTGTDGNNGWTKYPIAILPSGSIRSSIDEQALNGNITLENLLTVMPFQNTLYSVNISGSKLRKVFEHSVSALEKGSQNIVGRFLQMSGVKVVYDLNQPKDNRVISIKLRCGDDCRSPSYIPIDNEKYYNLVITSYMADGGDGFAMFKDKNLEKQNFETQDFDAVKDYLKSNNLIMTGTEERIVFTPPF